MKNLKNIILKAGIIILGLCPFISNAQWNYSGTSGNQTIYNSGTGKLGIGLSAPSELLHIQSSGIIGIRLGTGLDGSTYNGELSRISFYKTGDGIECVKMYAYNISALHGYYGGDLRFMTRDNSNNAYDRMTITYQGNVGIGTTSPNQKLHVVGNVTITGGVSIGSTKPNGKNPGTDYGLAVGGIIYAQEVDVTPSSSWSDYVFKSEYKLASLTEVEKYIKENGHLENVPSADQVAKNGFKLGEMDATLLRKTEELTLYLLEQDKKYQVQQKEIENLKAQLGNK